jgi:hypothetical protein
LKSFHPDATVFVVDLASGLRFQNALHSQTIEKCLAGAVLLDPKSESGSESISVPRLVFLSKNEEGGSNNAFSPKVHHHMSDPDTTILALPDKLSAYGDDGANSLWIARVVLKWMKAVTITRNTTTTACMPMLQSRL